MIEVEKIQNHSVPFHDILFLNPNYKEKLFYLSMPYFFSQDSFSFPTTPPKLLYSARQSKRFKGIILGGVWGMGDWQCKPNQKITETYSHINLLNNQQNESEKQSWGREHSTKPYLLNLVDYSLLFKPSGPPKRKAFLLANSLMKMKMPALASRLFLFF